MNLDKCLLVPTLRPGTLIGDHLVPEVPRSADGNFKLLEAPIGDEDWCLQLTRKRIRKIELILIAAFALSDAQATLIFLRNCGAFSKLNFPPE